MAQIEKIMFSIWLTTIPDIGIITANRLLSALGSAENVYKADKWQLEEVDTIGTAKVTSILQYKSLDEAEFILSKCEKKGISILTRDDPLFHRFLPLKNNAPVLLYCRGRKRNPKHTAGIVGPRRCTCQVKEKTAELAETYTEEGCAIISGMAKGVDSYAHTACINAGGYTIGVLGNGLDICYPSEHGRLMDAIAETGMLLSEYPPGIPPYAYHFPQRNRIIAALSDRLIVVEPGRKSGTIITSGYAEAMGKTVDYIAVDGGEPVFE